MNDPPLQPWLITSTDGTILVAHCTCMAGLGESCSHVGALLFWVEAAVKIRNSKTVTQSPAYWLLPTGIQKVAYEEVRDIDFTSATTKKRKLDESIMSPSPQTPRVARTGGNRSDALEPSREERDMFLKKLYDANTKSVLLSLMPGYAQHYKPASLDVSLPKVLSELYDENCVGMTSEDMQSQCDIIFDKIEVTPSQAAAVEERTRQQASSKDWFRFRTGRITASRLHAVCHTKLDKPSQSIVKGVCYPNSSKFRNKATDWGCDHEKTAIAAYHHIAETDHDDFKTSQSGLFLSSQFPFLGATPDSLVSCECCGDGCVEVKCPYCATKEDFSEPRKVFCLEKYNDTLRLKRTHPYFYQIQAQMFVCGKEYCDFVVWTPDNIHIERVQPDQLFWNEARRKAETFFKSAILPELVCKRFSRPIPAIPPSPQTAEPKSLQILNNDCNTTSSATVIDNSDSGLICICRKVYDDTEDRVVGCDNQNCPFVWLHFKCVNLKRAPKKTSTWYCPDCRKLPEFTK